MKCFCKNIFVLAVATSLFFSTAALAQDDGQTDSSNSIDMVAGDIQAVPAQNLTRVSITDPDIADISDAKADKVMVLGKKVGETDLFLWDDNGKRSVHIRVVSEDLGTVKARLGKLLRDAGIKGLTLNEDDDEGKVVVTGTVAKDDRETLEKILDRYGNKILNLTKEEKNEDLIQVDMQIVEINTSLEKNLGITWTNAVGSNESTATSNGTSSSASGLGLTYTETPPTTNGKIGDFFKIGDFNRTFQLQAQVNALLQEGKARLLSKPRLVVVSGKEASFLVGGEIPITSTTTSTTGSTLTQNTTFKQYGVNLTVTPTVRQQGRIDVMLNVEIRDIDNSLSTFTSSGDDVAFITRTAQTDLLLDNRQTIVLAGLIKHSDSEQLNEVPFFSKIPILGALFRNRQTPTPDSDTEMVIILTPTILRSKHYAERETVMPTPRQNILTRQIEAQYKHESLKTLSQEKAPTEPLTALTAYARSVQEKISQDITYPQEALNNKWQGTVELQLKILKDGTLATVDVVQPSGYDIFDQDAMDSARRAAPYPAFSPGMHKEDLSITIPIVYNQSNTIDKASQTVVASY